MQQYEGRSGNAGVKGFEILDDAIILEFQDGRQYLYSYVRPGQTDVEEMKKLAADGKGLTSYVNRHVHNEYDKRLK